MSNGWRLVKRTLPGGSIEFRVLFHMRNLKRRRLSVVSQSLLLSILVVLLYSAGLTLKSCLVLFTGLSGLALWCLSDSMRSEHLLWMPGLGLSLHTESCLCGFPVKSNAVFLPLETLGPLLLSESLSGWTFQTTLLVPVLESSSSSAATTTSLQPLFRSLSPPMSILLPIYRSLSASLARSL